MISASLLLLVLAFVLFVLAGVGLSASRINLVAAGLACATLSVLIGGL